MVNICESQLEHEQSELLDLVEQLTDELQLGNRAAIEEILQQHREYAPRLRDILPSLEVLAEFQNESRATGSGFPSNIAADDPVQGVLGDFRILRQIGRGGMGVVYEAQQLSINRKVALKILPLASLVDPRALQRFKNEVAAIATLEHPHIVSVYSVGEERGIHYFAMQLIRGQSTAAVIRELRARTEQDGSVTGASLNQVVSDLEDENTSEKTGSGFFGAQHPQGRPGKRDVAPLSYDKRDETTALETVARGRSSTGRNVSDPTYFCNIARLIQQAAEALQHAHDFGIVHRDVKPGNLLLDAHGTLFVTDFGLARIETGAGVTKTGEILGTLRYMSPEQVLANRTIVDHRTDIYSLGATLCELLTLQPMWNGEDKADLFRQISFEEPTHPKKINPSIPTDLETIILKAISKNPNDRYNSARMLSDDLQYFLDDKPILARRLTTVQRVSKWSRRNPGVMWTSLLVSLTLATVFGISTVAVSAARNTAEQQRALKEIERLEADKQRLAAIEQRNEARQSQYYAEMVAGQTQVDNGNPGGLYSDLITYLPLLGEQDFRGWEWQYLMAKCRPEERTITYPARQPFAAWSPDGKYIGTPAAIWEADSGKCIRRFSTSNILKYRVAWSPDGRKFAWGIASDENCFYIWDRSTDRISRLAGFSTSVWSLAWSPDGSQIASGANGGTLTVWDVASESVLWELDDFHGNPISIAWSPDSEMLAVGVWGDGGVQVWETASREKIFEQINPKVSVVAWHPDSNSLAVCEDEKWFVLKRDGWTIQYEQNIARGSAIDWSPDGSLIAVGHGETVDVWDSAGETLVAQLNGHRQLVNSVSWHPDGRRLVSCDRSQEVKLWDLDHVAMPAFDTNSDVNSIAWHDNGTRLAVENSDGSSTWWDPRDGTLKQQDACAVKSPAAISNYRNLAAVYDEDKHTLLIHDKSTGAIRSVIKVDPDRIFQSATFSRDGSKIVVQSRGESGLCLEVWNVDQEQTLWTWKGDHALWRLSWNADDSCFAAVGWGDKGDNGGDYWSDHVYVFDSVSGKRVHKFLPQNHKEQIHAVAWHMNGLLLAAGTEDGRLTVFDSEVGKRTFTEKIHGEGISSIAWHPTGNRVAVGTRDGEIKIVSSKEGEVLLNFVPFDTNVSSLAWSSDGQHLAAATTQGEIHTWDASQAYTMTEGDTRRGELAWAYYHRSQKASEQTQADLLREFVRLAPDDLGFWVYRGNAYSELGEFEQANEEYSKAIGPELRYSFVTACSRAWALLANHRSVEYNQACAKLVEVFRDSPVPSNRGSAAWLASLTNNHQVDSATVAEMARVSYDGGAARTRYQADDGNSFRLFLGGALYRDGQFEEANRLLTELAARLESDGDWMTAYEVACAKYFLSMSRFSLGQRFQSQRMLAEANEHADLFLERVTGKDWQKKIALATLRSEAAELNK